MDYGYDSNGNLYSDDDPGVDLSKVEPWGGSSFVLPEDEYVLEVVKAASVVPANNTTPHYSITYKVVEGQYTGKKFEDKMWTGNPSSDIGWRQLKALRLAVGLNGNTAGRPSELLGRRFLAGVGLRAWVDKKGAERHANQIESYEALEGTPQPQPQPQRYQQTPQQSPYQQSPQAAPYPPQQAAPQQAQYQQGQRPPVHYTGPQGAQQRPQQAQPVQPSEQQGQQEIDQVPF